MRTPRIVAALCTLGLVVGCSGGADAGADTTCKAFNRMSDAQQEALVSRLLEERGEADGPAVTADLRLSSARMRIGTGCMASENNRTKIGPLLD